MNARSTAFRTLIPALASLPVVALADGATLIYGNTSGWTVHTDPSTGYHCFAEAQYEGGSSIRIGFEANDGNLYLVLGDSSWSAPPGESADALELQFDDQPPLSFEPTAADLDALRVTVADEDRAAFLEAFMASYSLNAQYGNHESIMLSLGGSTRATRMLQECQVTMARVGETDEKPELAAASESDQ